MKNLFVGNMSFQTTEADIRALFEPFGQITRVHVVTDRETGRARGFAFVEMPNDEEAKKAIAGLDGKEVGGRNLKVNEARPKEPPGAARLAAAVVAVGEAAGAVAAGAAADSQTKITGKPCGNRANPAGRERMLSPAANFFAPHPDFKGTSCQKLHSKNARRK